jgi:hypothetical protein
MKTLRARLVIPAAVLLLLGISSTGVAQSTLLGSQVSDPPAAVQASAPEYGTSSQIIQKVSITNFRSVDSMYSLAINITGGVGFYQNIGGGNTWWAQVMLPAGAVVNKVELDGCDSSATGILYFGMATATAGGTSAENVTPDGNTGLAAAPGCGFWSVTPFSTIVINNLTTNYWLFLNFSGPNTSSLRVAGIRVYYTLEVSPAPGVATFGDVPTTHPFFKFVEALYASGITAGCGSGNFCPDTPLTRGQMAVFLSAALGLHWPN